jgi:molybdate transport system substrate-binding protein
MKIAAFILIVSLAVPSPGQEMTIAAAADLRYAFDEITSHFESETSVHVKVVYGSSGNIFQQIQNGAPFDLFFSANSDYPKKLEAAGLSVPGSYYEYARGHIVLLTSSSSARDLQQGLKVLLEPSVKRVAIADPGHAPYGQAAVAALKSQDIYDQVLHKIVVGENVAQAVSFVTSGAADIGIVAKSLAVLPSTRTRIRFVEIPASQHPPIQQACVVLKSSTKQEGARRFLTYIRGPEASKILQQYGFEVPFAKKAQPLR